VGKGAVVGGGLCGGFGAGGAGGVWGLLLGGEEGVKEAPFWPRNAKPNARLGAIHSQTRSDGFSFFSETSGFCKTR
jgi:hypothetical protein